MNVWIFNHYCVGPGSSGGTRHFDLAKELGRRGDRVTLFAASFDHQSRVERKFTNPSTTGTVLEEQVGDVQFIWFKTCAYHRNNWRRVVNILTYTVLAFWTGLRRKECPDVIIGSLMHPLAAFIGFLLARVKGCTFYFEERDLWPQTLIDLGKVSKHHPLVWLLRRLEHFLYRKAKRIIVLFDKAADYVESQGFSRDKVLYLPNGVDLQRFATPDGTMTAELEHFFQQQAGKFLAVYVGAHGIPNHLDPLLETASLLQEQGSRIHFLLVGDGTEKARLLREQEARGLRNMTFLPPVQKEQIPAILARGHAGLICMPDAELYKWGVSFNKMYDYMAAKLPIVMLSRYAESTVNRSGGGIIVETPAAMSEVLRHLADTEELRASIGQKGSAYVRQQHSWERLAEQLATAMQEDVGNVRQRDDVFKSDRASEAPSGMRSNWQSAVESKKWYLRSKRSFDLVASVFGMLLLSPLYLIVAILVRLKLGSPVLFRQMRPGLHGTPFWIYKFRTMNERRDANGQLLPDGERLTAFGKWLRKYSLDELPQLFNVVRGDISLVGPRPLLMSYLPLYNEEQKRRHDVRPGITGWAQVNGRNAIDWEQKFALDVWYVNHASFGLDLKILWLTVIKVIRSEGISMQGEATMSEFKGSQVQRGV